MPFARLLAPETGLSRWRVLALLPLTGVVLLVASSTVLVLLAELHRIVTGGGAPLPFERSGVPADATNPWHVVAMFAPIAIWVPALLLCYWTCGVLPVGRVVSVRRRVRWRVVAVTLLPAVAAGTAMVLVGLWVVALVTGEPIHPPRLGTSGESGASARFAVLGSLLLALLLAPFQAAAEEMVFRGAAVQALAALLPTRRWVQLAAWLFPTGAFVALHSYSLWGLIDVACLGVFAVWLTMRSGGLEAAIVLHAVNNVMLFAVMALGMTASTRVAEQFQHPLMLLSTAVQLLLFGWWVRHRLRRVGAWVGAEEGVS